MHCVDFDNDRTKARQLALKVGVPVVPGTDGPVINVEDARAFINNGVGYPVIIKAAHGGGGRGMRVVRNADELDENFKRASSEALSAFGNGEVFIERYVDSPRHIEVQILGDGTGDVVHLYGKSQYPSRIGYLPTSSIPSSPSFVSFLQIVIALSNVVIRR